MGGLLLLGVALPWLSPRQFEVQASGATYGYLMTLPVALMACVEALVRCGAGRAAGNRPHRTGTGLCR
jgi:hypothetical protein